MARRKRRWRRSSLTRSTTARASTWTYRSVRDGLLSRRRPSFSLSLCQTSIFTPSPHTTSCAREACRSVNEITRGGCAPVHSEPKFLVFGKRPLPLEYRDHPPFKSSRPSLLHLTSLLRRRLCRRRARSQLVCRHVARSCASRGQAHVQSTSSNAIALRWHAVSLRRTAFDGLGGGRAADHRGADCLLS